MILKMISFLDDRNQGVWKFEIFLNFYVQRLLLIKINSNDIELLIIWSLFIESFHKLVRIVLIFSKCPNSKNSLFASFKFVSKNKNKQTKKMASADGQKKKIIKLEDFMNHNTDADCWISVRGKVKWSWMTFKWFLIDWFDEMYCLDFANLKLKIVFSKMLGFWSMQQQTKNKRKKIQFNCHIKIQKSRLIYNLDNIILFLVLKQNSKLVLSKKIRFMMLQNGCQHILVERISSSSME